MRVTVFLFDDFDLANVLGAASVFGALPDTFRITYNSLYGDIINSTQGMKIWTDPLNPEEHSDVMIIPGGKGARRLIHLHDDTTALLKKAVNHTDICMMIANGSGLLAQTGLLYRRNVASSSEDENWKRMFTAAVNWIPNEHWVSDGKYYSSSKSIYSMDMALSIVADMIDLDAALDIAALQDYPWNPDDSTVF